VENRSRDSLNPVSTREKKVKLIPWSYNCGRKKGVEMESKGRVGMRESRGREPKRTTPVKTYMSPQPGPEL
jgi:hypothetical protein